MFDQLFIRSLDLAGDRAVGGMLKLGGSVTSTNDRAEWITTPNGPTLLLREGGQAPGFGAGVLASPSFNRTAEGGQHVLAAQLSGPGISSSNDRILWRVVGTQFTQIMREGATLGGLPAGVVIFNFSGSYSLSSGGLTAFAALLSGAGVSSINDQAFFAEAPGGMYLALREGNQAPQTPAGVLFFSLPSDASINDSGHVAAFCTLNGNGVTIANNQGIWLTMPAGPVKIARKGDLAPDGQVFTALGRPMLNNAGHMVFRATTGVEAIWRSIAGGAPLRLHAAGEQAPDCSAGTQFASFNQPIVDANSQLAFHANTTGGDTIAGVNDEGIWSTRTGQLRLVARKGQPMPEFGAGVILSDFFQPFAIDPVVSVGNHDEVLFLVTLSGPGVTTVNDLALMLLAADGQWYVLAREGDDIEVTPGDFRSVVDIAPLTGVTGENGYGRVIDDSGRVLLGLFLADGTEAHMLATPGAPCPADLTGSSDPNDPTYGAPDGVVDGSDFFFYLDQFVMGDLANADLTGSSDPNDPSYGIPDGILDTSDFFYYLDLFVASCP